MGEHACFWRTERVGRHVGGAEPAACDSLTSVRRSTADWLEALSGTPRDEALADLRVVLLRGLNRALAKRREVRPEDIQDFAQDALVRIVDRLGSFRGDSQFETWATAIAIRIALSALRRRRWKDVSLEEVTQPLEAHAASPPEASVFRAEVMPVLIRAIEDLPDRQRTVVVAELRGVPSEVIADRLGMKRNAVYKAYHDARHNLRRKLREAGISAEDVRDHLEGATHD